MWRLLVLAVSTLFATNASAATIHVPGDQPTIAAGLAAASPGDSLVLACGVYNEHDLQVGVSLHIVGAAASAGCVVIDGQYLGPILHCVDVAGGLQLENITFANGLAAGAYPSDRGGAIHCKNTPLGLRNCTFSHNSARQGYGGGIWLEDSPQVSIESCTFTDNFALTGGGLFVLGSFDADSDATIRNCSFLGNEALYNAAGAYFGFCTARIEDCRFTGNRCLTESYARGGAIYAKLYVDLELSGCVISDNAAAHGGGLVASGLSVVTVDGCTFARNSGGQGGALLVENDATVTLTACIIAYSLDGGAAYCATGEVAVSCCDIYANTLGNWSDCLQGMAGANGNFALDPRFCADLSERDFSIEPSSPCAPGNHPSGDDCGLIGALGVGCGTVGTRDASWSSIKHLY